MSGGKGHLSPKIELNAGPASESLQDAGEEKVAKNVANTERSLHCFPCKFTTAFDADPTCPKCGLRLTPMERV